MTDLSIKDFSATARRALDGDIRIARDKPDELVNKGTLGNRLATKLEGGRIHETLAERKQDAINAFRKALEKEYGIDVGEQAFEAVGLGRGQALTGRVVQAAVSTAERLQQGNDLNKEAWINARLPPSEEFDNFVKTVLGNDMTPQQLTEAEWTEYTTRLKDRVWMEGTGTPLSEQQVNEIAKDTLEQVH